MHLAHFSIFSRHYPPPPHDIDFLSTAIKLIQEFQIICQWLSHKTRESSTIKKSWNILDYANFCYHCHGTMVELDFAVTKIIPSTHFNAINFNCTLMYLKITMCMICAQILMTMMFWHYVRAERATVSDVEEANDICEAFIWT